VFFEDRVIAIFDKSRLNSLFISKNGRNVSELTVGELSSKEFIFVESQCSLTEVCRQWMFNKVEFAIIADDAY